PTRRSRRRSRSPRARWQTARPAPTGCCSPRISRRPPRRTRWSVRPGGWPWDAEQTHASLLPYLVEECYELYQAIEDGDGAAVREELGDVLLQVLFHARVASEAESEGASQRASASEERTELGSRPSGAEAESEGASQRASASEERTEL